jgi:hypothetical protein
MREFRRDGCAKQNVCFDPAGRARYWAELPLGRAPTRSGAQDRPAVEGQLGQLPCQPKMQGRQIDWSRVLHAFHCSECADGLTRAKSHDFVS